MRRDSTEPGPGKRPRRLALTRADMAVWASRSIKLAAPLENLVASLVLRLLVLHRLSTDTLNLSWEYAGSHVASLHAVTSVLHESAK